MPHFGPNKDKGGLADKVDVDAFDPNALRQGIATEVLEHGKDRQLAEEIAMDHLMIDRDFYKKYKRLEGSMNLKSMKIGDTFLTTAQENLDQKIIGFFKSKSTSPADDEVHAFAEKEGIDVHQLESAIYKILYNALRGIHLKHADDPDANFNAQQLQLGIDIEKEHHDDPAVRKAISKAHLAENPSYYTYLQKMEEEMKAAAAQQEQQPAAQPAQTEQPAATPPAQPAEQAPAQPAEKAPAKPAPKKEEKPAAKK